MEPTRRALDAPAAHPLPVLFRELRFGRPARAQDFLTWWANWIETNDLPDDLLDTLERTLGGRRTDNPGTT